MRIYIYNFIFIGRSEAFEAAESLAICPNTIIAIHGRAVGVFSYFRIGNDVRSLIPEFH